MTEALAFLAAAAICVPIAARLGLGSVLGYLIAGAAIGPSLASTGAINGVPPAGALGSSREGAPTVAAALRFASDARRSLSCGSGSVVQAASSSSGNRQDFMATGRIIALHRSAKATIGDAITNFFKNGACG